MDKKARYADKEYMNILLEWTCENIQYANYMHELKLIINNESFKQLLINESSRKTVKLALRKGLRHIYDNAKSRALFDNHPNVINQGIRRNDDSWTNWYIFEAENIETVYSIINSHPYIYIHADTFHSAYDCTGRMFSHEMDIKQIAPNRFFASK